MSTRGGIRTFLLGAIGCLFIVTWSALHFVPHRARLFTVNRGGSARQLAQDLYHQGLVWNPWSFLIWVKWYGASHIHAGVYTLDGSDTGYGLYQKFAHGPPLYKITFPEGWTSQQMAIHLETKGITSATDFMEIVHAENLEGRLFPDTYFFQQGLAARDVITRMVHQYNEMKPKDLAQQSKVLHLSEAQIVTLASMVEREARMPQERPMIAGVFLNRLKKHWRLESCATVEYSLGAWKPQLTYKDLEVNSPYNTYRHRGLPPGPICNPGAAALDAAAHPAKTDMMFFVAEGGGTHRFSKYYNEHLAVQKEIHKKR